MDQSRVALVAGALFCTAASGYLVGVHQAGGGGGTPPRTYVLNFNLFGRSLHLILTVGTMGLAVILMLTVLLAVAVILTMVASHRKRQAEAANRELETEIVERRRAQEAVSRLNAELERRVAERTLELQAANAELEAFCSSVAHDLRAPLRGIEGFSAALFEDCRGRLDQHSLGYLERIRKATARMGQLIDDLLALSRVSRAELRRQKVDLTALAWEVVADLRRADPERRAEVIIADGLSASGDLQLLHAALENLLGNAWKYSSKQPQARIEMGCRGEQHGQPVYFVKDNGAGFEMKYAGKLFKPFQRLHSVSEFPGAGVGLATVQRIIRRHGGDIWAESGVGQGATFYFTLGPAGDPDRLSPAPEECSAGNSPAGG
jgi:light-regulated signal transduction histidine kinase (bacteriophytochrome)